MNDLTTRLARVCMHLNQAGARYLVIGAPAVQLWGSARAIGPITVLIEPTADNAGRVLRGLAGAGLGFAREWLAERVASRAVTVLGDAPRVDILTQAGPIRYQDAALEAMRIDVEGVAIPTASIAHLIASCQTGRDDDVARVALLEGIRRLRGA